MFMHKLIAGMMFMLLYNVCSAQYVLKGKINDLKSGNAISGATVSIQKEGITTTQSDGVFMFNFKQTRTYLIDISSVGYNHKSIQVSIKNLQMK